MLFFFASAAEGQTISARKARVDSVRVIGNKRTKNFVILRELPFSAGDTINKEILPLLLKQARTQVFNTNLFTEVTVDAATLPDSSLAVTVSVKEKWYIYPTPQFQLADRNFNDWVKTYHANLNRVVYGVKFADYNFSGRRDALRMYLLNGYARNISATYTNPFIHGSLNTGMGIGAGFTQNREISYLTTSSNKLLDYRSTGFVRDNFAASIAFSHRKKFFKTVSAGLVFNYINVADSLLTSRYNPSYFNDSNHRQYFPDISVAVSYANTDNNAYPLRGLIYSYSLFKRGLQFSGGINSLVLQAGFLKVVPMGKHYYSSFQATGLLRLPFEQAYINRRALGYSTGLTMRGLEYYVVDGVAAGVAKYTLSKKIIGFRVPMPFHVRTIPYIPFTFYAKTFGDAGYSYIPARYETLLNNRFLYSGGFGVDVLTLYNIVLKFEYSFNQLGEKGLFLHGSGGF